MGKGPDETAHLRYIEHLAQTHRLPVFSAVSPGADYEFHQPPLYYVLALPGYLMTPGVGAHKGLTVRVFTLLLGLALIYLTYLLARRLAPDRPGSRWRRQRLRRLPAHAPPPRRHRRQRPPHRDLVRRRPAPARRLPARLRGISGGQGPAALLAHRPLGRPLHRPGPAHEIPGRRALPRRLGRLSLRRPRPRKVRDAAASPAMLGSPPASPFSSAAGGWCATSSSTATSSRNVLSSAPSRIVRPRSSFMHRFGLTPPTTSSSCSAGPSPASSASSARVHRKDFIFYPAWVYEVAAAFVLLALIGFLAYLKREKLAAWQRQSWWLAGLLGLLLLAGFIGFNVSFFQAQARYLFPALARRRGRHRPRPRTTPPAPLWPLGLPRRRRLAPDTGLPRPLPLDRPALPAGLLAPTSSAVRVKISQRRSV